MELIKQERFVTDYKTFQEQGKFSKIAGSDKLRQEGDDLVRLAEISGNNENVQKAINNYVTKLNAKIKASKGTPQREGDTILDQYMSLEKGDKVRVQYGSVVSGTNDKVLVVTKGRTFFAKNNVERIILKDPENLKGVKYYLYNRQGRISFAVGDMATSLQSIDVLRKPNPKPAPKPAPKPKPKQFKPGDKWSEDFDYDGMMDFANKVSLKTPLNTLEKLAASMTDVNYHSEAKRIYKLIEQKKNKPAPKPKPKPKPAPKKVGDNLKQEILAGKYKDATKREILAIAKRYNASRRPESIKVDNKRDNSKRIEPTPENLVRWVKAPGKYDFIGADNYKENDVTVTFKQKKEAFWKRLMKK